MQDGGFQRCGHWKLVCKAQLVYKWAPCSISAISTVKSIRQQSHKYLREFMWRWCFFWHQAFLLSSGVKMLSGWDSVGPLCNTLLSQHLRDVPQHCHRGFKEFCFLCHGWGTLTPSPWSCYEYFIFIFIYIYQNTYVFTYVIYLYFILSIFGLSSNNLRIKFFLESQISGKFIPFLCSYLRFESEVTFETLLSSLKKKKRFLQSNYNLGNVEPKTKKSKFCY